MQRPGALVALVLVTLFATAALAHDIPPGELAALGRIWGVVRYAHPWVGYRDIPLDEATLRAIAKVRGGATAGVGADELLRALGDDATHVTPVCYDASLPPVDRSTKTLADGIVYLSRDDAQARAALQTARAAIVDLRPQPGRCAGPILSSELGPLLVRGTIPYAMHRKVRHYGYRAQDGEAGGFESKFITVDVGSIQGTSTTLTRVVFIVDERSLIPPVATALAAAGQATFVSVGAFPLHSAVDHCQMALGDGSIVTLRTSELVDKDGYSAEPSAMITLAANAAEGDVIAAAQQLAKPRSGRRRATGGSSVKLGAYDWRADASFASTELPSPEQRILAAFRLWNVIHFFHGSRDQLGAWNLSLGTIADKLADAQTRRDYELALAESLALVRDNSASVETPSLVALHGAAAPPFELMQVEGKPVVTMSASEQVKPGDELLRIDGRDATLRLNELARYTAEANAVRDLAKGAAGTTSLFAFRRADGSQYEVPLARGANVVANPAKAWRILNGNVAYVDARTLDDLDALFNEVASTRAMIIDLRGEHVNAELVQRLNVTGNAVTSRVPVLLGGAYNFADAAETIAATTGARYDRPTIALVDERTPADVALALQALARTRFVGTAMAGAHGDTSSLVVPGNITIRFTATELHNAKGRAGIEPDFMVERTIRGLAEGRDELLDAALAILQ